MTPGSGSSTGGSSFNGGSMTYPSTPDLYNYFLACSQDQISTTLMSFTCLISVYSANDFTPRSSCPSSNGDINNYGNAIEVRNCKLSGMPDLNQGKIEILLN
jgi:alpha-amylase